MTFSRAREKEKNLREGKRRTSQTLTENHVKDFYKMRHVASSRVQFNFGFSLRSIETEKNNSREIKTLVIIFPADYYHHIYFIVKSKSSLAAE